MTKSTRGFGQEVESLQVQFNQLKTDVTETLSQFEIDINSQVDLKLQNNLNQVMQLLSDYQTIFNNSIENLRTDLEQEIREVELGNVIAYNPTNR